MKTNLKTGKPQTGQSRGNLDKGAVETMDKKEQMKRLAFFVMGDGGVYMLGKNASFIMNMKQENIDYINEFASLVDFTKVRINERKDYNTDGYNRQPQYRVETGRHPIWTKFRERIYTDHYKGLDPIYVKQIDWHDFAILWMSDGSLGEYYRPEIGMKNPSYSMTLNMKRLSYGDLKFLGECINKNLGIHFKINRQNQYYYLRFSMKDFDKIMTNLEPFIHPSFRYKIRTVSPQRGDEIVRTSQECEEVSRND